MQNCHLDKLAGSQLPTGPTVSHSRFPAGAPGAREYTDGREYGPADCWEALPVAGTSLPQKGPASTMALNAYDRIQFH